MLNLGPKITVKAGTTIAEATPMVLKVQPQIKETINTIQNEDAKQLWEDLRLEENPMLKEKPDLLQEVKDLVWEYRDVFSNPEQDIGKTNLIEFSVTLKPGSKPVRQKVRPLNPNQKADLRKQLDLWTKEEVIEETESPWASALVPALKKDKSIRWAVDYRGLNACTIADAYPLPNIQENLDKL